MARITSKLQVTIPKRVAEEFGLEPGDDVDFVLTGGGLRVVRANDEASRPIEERLAQFDAATARQRARDRASGASPRASRRGGRGWTRASLYDRARPR